MIKFSSYLFMSSGVSDFADRVDFVFALIIGISVLFLVFLTGLVIYILIRFNHKRNKVASKSEGSTKLEIIWTIVPTILVMVMFYYGYSEAQFSKVGLGKTVDISVLGRKWTWEFEYINGKISKDTLLVPVNETINLTLISNDIIHSFSIPAFRLKKDVVPSYRNNLWFTPKKLGTYDIFCTEYCGLQHYAMLGKLLVVEQKTYEAWLKKSSTVRRDYKHPGYKIVVKYGCIACHTLNGTTLIGPTFMGLFGKVEKVITDGEEREIIVDYEYIKQSIYDPNADVVKGISSNLMPSFKGRIKEEDAKILSDFIKTLK